MPRKIMIVLIALALTGAAFYSVGQVGLIGKIAMVFTAGERPGDGPMGGPGEFHGEMAGNPMPHGNESISPEIFFYSLILIWVAVTVYLIDKTLKKKRLTRKRKTLLLEKR